MGVLVTYKGTGLRHLGSGSLSLLTANHFMEADVDVWNYGPETAAIFSGNTAIAQVTAEAGKKLLTAGKTMADNIRIEIVTVSGNRFIPSGSDSLITADGKTFFSA